MGKNAPVPPDALSRVVSIALSRPDLSVLSEMLVQVADELGAHGCALWQIEPRLPGMRAPGEESDENLLAIAAGFHDRLHYPEHDLPSDVTSGSVMRTGLPQLIADVSSLSLPERAARWVARTGIGSLCAVPVRVYERPGALTVYRQRAGDWDEREVRLLEYLAVHIPALYHTVRDRVSFRILEEISAIIREAEEDPGAPPQKVRASMQKVCEAVAKGFQCLETAIYLENPLESPGCYRNVATTCPPLLHNEQYRKDEGGFTPWVLRNGPIAVVDVRDFDHSRYLGLDWRYELKLEETVRGALRISADEELPPISFMAVPISLGKRVYGVIRCCAAVRAPYYFARRETDLLELIASRVGHFWSNLIDRQDLNRELDMWQRFAKQVSAFNKSVQNDLTGGATDQRRILRAALSVARDCLIGADYVDVSLADLDRCEITLSAVYDRSGPAEPARGQRAYRFDEDPPRTPAAILYRTRAVFRLEGESPPITGGLPGVRQAVYAPILGDGDFLGMIAVRGKGEVRFPEQANEMLLLLGHLTGLYLRLQVAIEKQAQTYRMFLHQLRSPVFQAHKRAARIREATKDKQMDAVCGLLGKVKLLVINLRLFSNLASGEPIQPDLHVVGPGDLIRPLIELASENRTLWQQNRIGISVDTDSFQFAASLSIDIDLFEQAAGNVLDNFGKYGTFGATITVAASLHDSEMRLSFRGQSIPISPEGAKRAGTRGWRGREAMMRSVDGSGIGLWMAKEVLNAHRGRLEVSATDADGYNEMRMVFPVAKP
jgi:signal transduction histidine kinase